ncbi:MAG: hypothetical protein Q9174_003452 [Haloplaca sp. 1 TL-2023]
MSNNRRIVEDSDGEDNLDDSPIKKACEATAQASSTPTIALDYDDSSQQRRGSASAGPSTGSTERLNRDIDEAYDYLLAPSTSRSTRSSDPFSGSPSQSARRVKIESGEKVVKPPRVTYGAKKRKDSPTGHFDSDDDDSPRPRKRVRRSSGNVRGAEYEYKDDTENCTSLDIDGQGPLNRVGGSDPKKKANGKDSSSGQPMLPPPPRPSGSAQHDPHSSGGSTIPFTDPTSRPTRDYGLGSRSPDKYQSTEPQGLESSPPTLVQRKTRKRAASEIESPKITLGEEIPPSSSAPAESPIKRPRRDRSQPNHASLTSPTKSDAAHDELSLSLASSPTNTRKPNTSGKRPSRHSQSTSEVPEDDLLPDIPAETYQARPSRSRSAKSIEDLLIPTDFSKRPEALAKSKRKGKGRRQKTDTSVDEDVSLQPDDSAELNTPAKVEENATQEKEHTINTKAEGAAPLEENPTPPTKPSKKAKKARGRPKQEDDTKQSSTTTEPPKPADTPAAITEPVAPTPAPGKRGRKRKTPISDDFVHEDAPSIAEDAEAATDMANPPLAADSNVLKKGDGNILPLKDPMAAIDKKNDALASPEKQKIKTPSCKETPKPKSENKENGSSSGKALYRVGLSKRQRIAPLLRVVRK